MSSLMQVFSSESELIRQLLAMPLQSESVIVRLGAPTGRIGPLSDSSQPRLASVTSLEALEKVEQDDEITDDVTGGGRSPNLLQTLLRAGSLMFGALSPGFLAGVISPSLPQPRSKLGSVLYRLDLVRIR